MVYRTNQNLSGESYSLIVPAGRSVRVLAVSLLLVLMFGSILRSEPVRTDTSIEKLPESVTTFLSERGDNNAKVWVFFGDKGNPEGSPTRLSETSAVVSERSLIRRAKNGVDAVVRADLPVYQPYVEAVVERGGDYLRSSRWLNAASFFLPMETLPAIAALPFVTRIRPVARFRKPVEPTATVTRTYPPGTLSDGLNYGPSLGQVYQINAVAAHLLGYSGDGVTLAITDTGFRPSHSAFTSALAEGRLLAQYDFVDNDANTFEEPGDFPNQTLHGTLVWSIAAGNAPGQVIGPAYGANIVLCKTEDLSSETSVEEDNWVAALEFADSVGADVINTSLGYSDWYTYEDFDGQTAVISLAANSCEALGIILCASMGNDGPGAGSLTPPADAFDVLSVGGVYSTGTIVGFSSRGPTFDGRTKPEVCAQAVSVYGGLALGDDFYGTGDGTSFSSPLIAGAVCLMLEARPDLSPALIREALMATASQAATPDNTYGHGIVDVGQALLWPVGFAADTTFGGPPLEVHFMSQAWLEPISIEWDFGDGSGSDQTSPVHTYYEPGVYDVTVSLETVHGPFSRTIENMVAVEADSVSLQHVEASPGSSTRIEVLARNFLPLDEIEIPISWAGELDLTLDSFSTAGLRTESLSYQGFASIDSNGGRATIQLSTDGSGLEPPLPPGAGPVLSLYFSVPHWPFTAYNPIELKTFNDRGPELVSAEYRYSPVATHGSIRLGCCLGQVGNIDRSPEEFPTIGDVSLLVDHLFISLAPLDCLTEADIDQSGGHTPDVSDLSIGDVARLVDYLFIHSLPDSLADCP